jgi:hypothetical protein
MDRGRGASGLSLEQWSRACWPANRKPPDIVWTRQCLALAWWYPMKAGPGSDRMPPDEPGVSRCGGRRRRVCCTDRAVGRAGMAGVGGRPLL